MFDSPQPISPQSPNFQPPPPKEPIPEPDPAAPVQPDPLAPSPFSAQETRSPINSSASIPAADMLIPEPNTLPRTPGIPPSHTSPQLSTNFPNSEHHSSKHRLIVFLIILAVVIIGGGGAAYFLLQSNITENDNENINENANTANLNQNSNANINTNVAINQNTSQTQNLVYTDTQYGFTIEYPNNWTVDTATQGVLVSFTAPENEYGSVSAVGLAITWEDRDNLITHVADLLESAEDNSSMEFTLEDEVITTVDSLSTTARIGELTDTRLTYPIMIYHTGAIYSDAQVRIAGTAMLPNSGDWEDLKQIFNRIASSFDRTSNPAVNQNINANSSTNGNANITINTNASNTNTVANKNTNQSSALNDADGDNLTDSQETAYGTNPDKADTDDDGLNDFREIFIYNTDPLDEDSDGDTYLDGEEVENGYDPNGSGTL
ncbi:MAG: hypothetical protein V1853_02535 [bacterium]